METWVGESGLVWIRDHESRHRTEVAGSRRLLIDGGGYWDNIHAGAKVGTEECQDGWSVQKAPYRFDHLWPGICSHRLVIFFVAPDSLNRDRQRMVLPKCDTLEFGRGLLIGGLGEQATFLLVNIILRGLRVYQIKSGQVPGSGTPR